MVVEVLTAPLSSDQSSVRVKLMLAETQDSQEKLPFFHIYS